MTTAVVVAAAIMALGTGPFVARAQRADAGDAFQATLAPVRADRALDFWYRTPQLSGPNLAVVERVHPNDSVLLLVLLHGIGDVGGGKGQVTLRISTVDGEGVTEVLGEDIPAWDGELPPKEVIVLSRALPEFSLDDEEAPGTITVVVEARDEASGKTARTEAALELTPWSYGQTPADGEAFNGWMASYHRAPQPGQAVRAYLEYADVEEEKSGSWNFAVLGFYRTIFQTSPWLVEHLVGRLEQCDDAQRMKLFVMLQLVGQAARIDDMTFGDADARTKTRAAVEALVLPDPYAAITGPQQLDLLWGEFLASGRYAPIRQLVTALELAPFEEAVEEFAKSSRTEKDTERFWKGVTFQAARWSLDSNMQQYPLVLAYARFVAENEPLGKHERKQLDALLEKHAHAPQGAGR